MDILHDSLVRCFRVICMSIVNRIILPLAHITGKRLPMIIVCSLVIRRPMLLDKIRNKRIRASRVIGRVRKGDDVLVLSDGEAFNMAHLVQIFLCQFPFLHVKLTFSYQNQSLLRFTTIRSVAASFPLV